MLRKHIAALLFVFMLLCYPTATLAGMVQRATPSPRFDKSNTYGHEYGVLHDNRGTHYFTVLTRLGGIYLVDDGTAMSVNRETGETIEGHWTEYNDCAFEVYLDNYTVYVIKPACYGN